MKRLLFAVTLTAVALLGLTACGNSTPPDPADTSTHLQIDQRDSPEDIQFENCLNWVLDNHPDLTDKQMIQACTKMIATDPTAFKD